MLYTLAETAKAAGLEPRAKLHYLFDTLPTVTAPEGIEALLPHRLTPEFLKLPTRPRNCNPRSWGYPDTYTRAGKVYVFLTNQRLLGQPEAVLFGQLLLGEGRAEIRVVR